VLLFGAGAALVAGSDVARIVLPPTVRELLFVAIALLGPLGAGVERGRERPAGWGGALLLGLGAAGSALGTLALLGTLGAPGWTALVASILTLGGALIARRLGPRLDRGEAGWRAAARAGPPDGGSPLADWIAERGLRAPWRWLLLPVELPVRAAILGAIALYQLTASRLMPPACRFEPTCSRYGFHAVLRHGSVRGSLLTGLRLLRCSPLSNGGFDPVPEGSPARRWPPVHSHPTSPEASR
jgi:putative membrane protein insertion efficiency factor